MINDVLEFKTNTCGGFIDVEEFNGRVYAIQCASQFEKGRLCVFDKELNLIENFVGIGDARQIKIFNGIAVVSARANGIYIFDVTKNKPTLLSRYRTVELATGITIFSNLVFVSCRQYGVEVVDISNPSKPVYKGVVRVGEVQSTCVYGNVLYCGLWGDMKVVAVRLDKLPQVEIIGEYLLDGRGDGVCVFNKCLYAVSGQHSRNIKNFSDKNDPAFANGNGIRVFDISNDKEILFEDKFGSGYSAKYDTWKPILCGNKIVCADSVLGIRVYDSITYEKLLTLSLPSVNNECDAVMGVTSLNGALYVAAVKGGLYKYDKMEFEESYRYVSYKKIDVKKNVFNGVKENSVQINAIHFGDLSVYAVDSLIGKYLILACGEDGLNVIEMDTYKLVYKACDGYCSDVKVYGTRIYGAFNELGLRVYELKDSGLEFLNSYACQKEIQQVCLSQNGCFAACCLESTELIMLDVSDVNKISTVFSRKAKYGPIYGENFASNKLEDGTMLMFWHRDGLIYSNPENGDKEFKEIFYNKRDGFMCFGPETGIDTDGRNIFFNVDGGYVLLPLEHNVDVCDLEIHRADSAIIGKFAVMNNLMISVERSKGVIAVTDISDIKKPHTINFINVSASCYKPQFIDGHVYLATGRDGLLEMKISSKK
jgi:hypothetical protein